MTADAKVGLLLGLFFIIVIAFLINGLPKFLQDTGDEQVTTQIEIPTAPDMVIDNRVAETARNLPEDIPLRQTSPPEQVVILGEEDALQTSHSASEQIPSVSVQVPDIPIVSSPPLETSDQPRYHVVQRGEMLPVIAKKYYGSEHGNRRIVIRKLYEANQDVLESPDKVCVGDKLKIPPLSQLLGESDRTLTASVQVEQPSLLSRFANFFEPVDAGSSSDFYVVQQGESLWSIAEKTLGDGKRYKEIVDLNNNIEDPDDVRVGMNLRIPQS